MHYLTNRSRRNNQEPICSISWLPLSEDNDVLTREDLDRLDPIQREHGRLPLDLNFCHFVQGFDGHGGIFSPILDEYHATARLNRPAERLHDLGRKVEFVIQIG